MSDSDITTNFKLNFIFLWIRNSKRLPCQGKNDLVLNYGYQSFWDQWANFYLHNLTGPPCCSCDGSLTVLRMLIRVILVIWLRSRCQYIRTYTHECLQTYLHTI